MRWYVHAPRMRWSLATLIAVVNAADNPLDYAKCLGNFDTCYAYVESITKPSQQVSQICDWSPSDCSKSKSLAQSGENGDPNSITYNSPITETSPITTPSQEDYDNVFERLSKSKKERKGALISYFDFCGLEEGEKAKALRDLIEDKRICFWGDKSDHVSLSLDKHVYGLSHFAEGFQQVLNMGLEEHVIRPQGDRVMDICNEVFDASGVILDTALGIKTTEDIEESSYIPREISIHDSTIGGKYTPHPLDLIELAGESIGDIIRRFREDVLKVLQTSIDFGKVCGATAPSKRRQDHLITVALMLTHLLRQYMLNVRTSIGLKLMFLEVTQSQETPHPAILPKYNYIPIAYGRHWDMLDSILMGEFETDPNQIVIDRDVRFLLRNQPDILYQKRNRPLKILEIGVAVGQNGVYLLRKFPNLHYTGVDPTIAPEVQEKYKKIFDGSGFEGERYKLHPTGSEEIADLYPDRHFDFIFVDGPHTYKQVTGDLKLFSSKVKVNGYLIGHDFTCVHPPLLWGISNKRLWGQEINYGMDGVWWWRNVEEQRQEL